MERARTGARVRPRARRKASTRPTVARAHQGRSTVLTAAAGLLAVAGGLFVTGALDPVVTEVLATAGNGSDPADRGEQINAGRIADWMYYEDVPEWSSVRGVPQVSGPTQATAPTRPAIAPPEHPHRVLMTGPPPMPTYEMAPRDDCMQPHNPVSIAHNFVATATGNQQVSVRWWDMGDPDTQRYEVVAVPEYVNFFDYSRPRVYPPKRFSTVIPSGGCAQMRTTVTGLQAGSSYTFVLMAINRSPLNNNRIYSITRARSEPITVS